jgi:hypothetical protein
MAQIKQHLSELIGHQRGIVMSCGLWRTPPQRPFPSSNPNLCRSRA